MRPFRLMFKKDSKTRYFIILHSGFGFNSSLQLYFDQIDSKKSNKSNNKQNGDSNDICFKKIKS